MRHARKPVTICAWKNDDASLQAAFVNLVQVGADESSDITLSMQFIVTSTGIANICYTYSPCNSYFHCG